MDYDFADSGKVDAKLDVNTETSGVTVIKFLCVGNSNVIVYTLQLRLSTMLQQQFRHFMVSIFRSDLQWGLSLLILLIYVRSVTE